VREGKKNAVIPLVLVGLVITLVLWPQLIALVFRTHSNQTAFIAAGVLLAILAVWTPPLAGFTICFFLWKNLSWNAWIVGGIWMILGIAFGAWKTKGFRGDLVSFDLPPEE
jgi:uncharacterized membrane protein